MNPSRREFLRRAGLAVAMPVALTRDARHFSLLSFDSRYALAQDKSSVFSPSFSAQDRGRAAPARPDSLQGADRLTDPARVGSASRPLGPLDNDPGVIAIERRLRCNCGCTLDVYTCRTTDFSCDVSPAMHLKVVTQVEQGATPDQVVQWFVAQPEYGEKVLMAPPPRGFNLMGYLLPSAAVLTIGAGLVVYLTRRRAAVAAAVPMAPLGDGPLDEAQRERLRRALDEVDG